MSYLTTGLDLKIDALTLAGEPTNGTSDFEASAYEWLTVVQRSLVSGGMFGPSFLQPCDWFWARAWPRGAIQMVQPYNVNAAAIGTFTTSNTTMTVTGVSALPDLTGYRIIRSDTPARHIIDSVNNNATPLQITLRQPWSGDVFTDGNWMAYPDTYLLPEDFVRGTSPLFLYAFPSNLPTTATIDVIDPVDLERMYPQTFPWGGNASATVTGSGLPVLAARVDTRRIRFSHFLLTENDPFPAQLEFEYIRRPPVIAEGTIPLVPVEHRRILSYGAAFLILNDKKNTQDQDLYKDFHAQYKAMRDEYARDARRMSSRYGVVQPARLSGNRSIMLTETGLPIYVW